MRELVIKKSPKMCGWKSEYYFVSVFNQSTVSAPAQYISQFYTAVYYLPGLLHFCPFVPKYGNVFIMFFKL